MLPGVAPERYELIRLIGRGAMGDVYCARDTKLQRHVALKVLRTSDLSDNDGESARSASVMRMMREARAAAALEHPNIIAVYDVGQIGMGKALEASCFIAMELIEGRRLRDYIGRNDVPLERRLTWLVEIARALAFAHDRGIIHRDIKPENVMIRDDGVAKVLDFGLARRLPNILPDARSVALPTLTEKGSVVGTVLYMAPEQMCGDVLDGRADQFSWGVIAYELLAGKPPWPGLAASIQIVAQIFTREPVPIHTLEPALPPGLGQIVHRAIARNKDDRYASLDVLLDALDAFMPSAPPSKRASLPTAGPSASTHAADAPTVSSRFAPAGASDPKWTRRGWPVAGLVTVALGSAFLVGHGLLGRTRDQAAAASRRCANDRECGPERVCRGGSCESRNSCRTNADCTKTEGQPAICRSTTGGCVALGSDDCHAVAEPSDVENDRTVWFGAMFPLVGEEAQMFGKREFQAVDFARSDFADMLRGMHTQGDGKGLRPIALVACDDSVDASRAARHLVDDIGAPAIIGFRTSKEVIDLSTSMFIPRGVLTVAALNTSPIITSLPRIPGQPRMVLRTTYSSSEAAAPIGLLISEVLEPEIRARSRALARGEGMRVALVVQNDPAGVGFADALFRTLRFNGRSALENESTYREISYPFDTSDGKEPDLGQVAAKLLSFAPHVIIHFGADEALVRVLEVLERDWKTPAFRPRYVKPTALGPGLLAFIGERRDRQRRFFSITSAPTNPPNARFVARYSEVYPEQVMRTFSPNSSYDAFYLLAYATYALGPEPVNGPALARMIGHLLPPGRSIDVGPNGIFDAVNALAAGEHIDLNGATGRLDFDLDTGEAPVDLAILCVKVDADPAATVSVESGLTYDATAGVLRGAMQCP